MPLDLTQLSKTVSHALRHQPWLYELELDEQGWTDISILLEAMRRQRPEWRELTEQDLQEMIACADKQRHEIAAGRIRAIYGHSIPGRFLLTPAVPPEVLYHGTTPMVAEEVVSQGLLPMKRQYVHLSVDIPTAIAVARRKSLQPVILQVSAALAAEQGVRFYKGNDRVWLADSVPAGFLKRIRADVSPSSA